MCHPAPTLDIARKANYDRTTRATHRAHMIRWNLPQLSDLLFRGHIAQSAASGKGPTFHLLQHIQVGCHLLFLCLAQRPNHSLVHVHSHKHASLAFSACESRWRLCTALLSVTLAGPRNGKVLTITPLNYTISS